MPITPNELQNILGKAQKLCNSKGDKLVQANIDQSGFKKQLDENYEVPSVDDYDDAAKWDSLYSENAGEDYEGDAKASKYFQERVAKSALPEHIKKSMMSQPPLTEDYDGGSVLDSLNIKGQRVTAAQQKRAQINEGRQPQPSSQSSAVDYSIIKAIVSQCVNEALEKSGGALNQIYLEKGVVTLVDSKGNIFRAKLEKIGNKNDNN